MPPPPYVSDRSAYPKLAREALLRGLSGDLRASLEKAPTLDEVEVSARRATIFPIDPGGIGGKTGSQPEGYWFKRAGKPARAIRWVESHALGGDGRSARLIVRVWFSEPESTTPRAARSLMLGFATTWICGRRLLPAFVSRHSIPFALVSDDGALGVAVSCYGGYLAEDLDDGETVYEVARWHPFA